MWRPNKNEEQPLSKPRTDYLGAERISDGLFSNEKTIILADYKGDLAPGFFQNHHIRDGRLEVKILKEEEGLVLVKLPGETIDPLGDKSYITVRKDQLYAA